MKLQQQALSLSCPDCGGKLRTQGRDFVRCLRCWNGFRNRDVVGQPSPLDRFWQKVEKTPTCWNWKGATDRDGYGYLGFDGRFPKAHRLSYELAKGKIPEGLEIDHLCKNPSCVNPDHLEAITHRANVLRGNTIVAYEANKTHCPKGHPLAGDNLSQAHLRRGHRTCRICNNEWKREDYYRRKNGFPNRMVVEKARA